MTATSSSRRHTCSYCGRSFAKAEHLSRHERIHSGTKPYACSACGRRFARNDSLARHQRRAGHAPHDGPGLATSSLTMPGDDEDGEDAQPDSPVSLVRPIEPVGSFNAAEHRIPSQQTLDTAQPLVWPASEDLLQSILNSNFEQWNHIAPDTFESEVQTASGRVNNAFSTAQLLPILTQGSPRAGEQAVRDISQIISDLSVDVTARASLISISPAFLDECLHSFFHHFIPAFPVLHQPTFEFRNWTHTLLINAIALGSLYLGDEAHSKQGEVLWRLAHVAVATSWPTLITQGTPHDKCNGVQLVATAFLGQTYAMLSSNDALRLTARMFHSLGFNWAQECDMYTTQPFTSSMLPNAPAEELDHQWREWVAQEVQVRVLLAHYILDSQISQFICSVSQNHMSNELRLPSTDQLFEATSAVRWAELLRQDIPTSITFRQLYLILYGQADMSATLPFNLPVLAIKVMIEGLQSVIPQSQSTRGAVVGCPSHYATRQALARLYRYIVSSPHLSQAARAELLLRWHTVYIDALCNSTSLCRRLCETHAVEQNIFRGSPGPEIGASTDWIRTSSARQALLHAIATHELLQDLPLGRLQSIHIPMTIFMSALVHCAFLLGGTTSVKVPEHVSWTSLFHDEEFGGTLEASTPAREFIAGHGASGPARSHRLFYDTKVLALRLKQQGQPWGIAKKLHGIIEKLVACRQMGDDEA